MYSFRLQQDQFRWHDKIHGIPWNFSCHQMGDKKLLGSIWNISILYLFVCLFHPPMFYYQDLRYTTWSSDSTHYVSQYHSTFSFRCSLKLVLIQKFHRTFSRVPWNFSNNIWTTTGSILLSSRITVPAYSSLCYMQMIYLIMLDNVVMAYTIIKSKAYTVHGFWSSIISHISRCNQL